MILMSDSEYADYVVSSFLLFRPRQPREVEREEEAEFFAAKIDERSQHIGGGAASAAAKPFPAVLIIPAVHVQ